MPLAVLGCRIGVTRIVLFMLMPHWLPDPQGCRARRRLEVWAVAHPSRIVPLEFAQPWAEELSAHSRAGAPWGLPNLGRCHEVLLRVLETWHKEQGPLPGPELPSSIRVANPASPVFLFLIKEGDTAPVLWVVCSLQLRWHGCTALGGCPSPGIAAMGWFI